MDRENVIMSQDVNQLRYNPIQYNATKWQEFKPYASHTNDITFSSENISDEAHEGNQ